MPTTVRYMDRRGGGWMRYFTNDAELHKFVSKLHREATIERDGEEVGRVWRNDGAVDDRRVKWLWAFEKEVD